MSKYVEKNLGKNETIVKKADRNGLFLVATWIKGILLCWLLLIPKVKAIIATVRFKNVELAVTTKRIIGKIGVASTQALDAPLNKVQNVAVAQPFFGRRLQESDHVSDRPVRRGPFETAGGPDGAGNGGSDQQIKYAAR